MAGVASGSLLLFVALAVGAVFFGRAWCAWACPMGGWLADDIHHVGVPIRSRAGLPALVTQGRGAI